jgi:hypothetical protein
MRVLTWIEPRSRDVGAAWIGGGSSQAGMIAERLAFAKVVRKYR